MHRRHIRSIALVLPCAGALLLQGGCAPGPQEVRPLERMAESPERVQLLRSGAPPAAETAAHRWTGAQVGEWDRKASEGWVTLTSPELDFESLLEIDAIRVEVAHFRGRDRLTLQWNDRPVFRGTDGSRQRRELTARPGREGSSFLIRGDDVVDVDMIETADQERAPRFLFLRFRSDPVGDVAFESVEIASRDAVLGARDCGWTRMSVAGRIRDAFFLRTPGAFRWRVDLSRGGVLDFGVWGGEGGAPIRIAVTAGEGGEALLQERLVPTGSWRDFRVPIPPGSAGELRFEVDGERPGQAIHWANPMLVRGAAERERPNVILYVVDALRAEQMSLHGYPRETSPVLDGLAGRGVVFQNAYSPVSWTKPSVATLLTSLYPQVHGVGERSYGDVLPEGVPTLQDVLRAHGYVTASFCANPLGCTLSNLDQGFDETFTPNSFRIEGREAKQGKVHADDLNAEILPWIRAHARDRFFLYVQAVDTHVPYSAPETPPHLIGEGGEINRYDAEIHFVDRQIGRLWEELEELGLAEDTLLIVTADHGESFGEHGQSGHGTHVHQQETWVPLILVHPRRLSPRRIATPVQLIDLMPTVLAHLGIDGEGLWMQGSDVLDEASLAGRGSVFLSRFVYPEDMDVARFNRVEYHAVVDGRLKLIAGSEEGRPDPKLELYDLARDPGETRDLSRAEPGRTEGTHAELRAFLERQARSRAAFLAAYGGEAEEGDASPRETVSEGALEQLRALGYLE